MNLVQSESIQDIEDRIKRQIAERIYDHARDFGMVGPGGHLYIVAKTAIEIAEGTYS